MGNVDFLHSTLDIPAFTEAELVAFWSLVDRRSNIECWPWKGTRTRGGRGGGEYGLWYVGGIQLRPHRISFVLAGGIIPDGFTIDHVKDLCSDTLCCNPGHTEPVTQSENSLRRVGATATACRLGHPRMPGTECRTCRSDINRRYNQKRGKHVHPTGSFAFTPERPSAHRGMA